MTSITRYLTLLAAAFAAFITTSTSASAQEYPSGFSLLPIYSEFYATYMGIAENDEFLVSQSNAGYLTLANPGATAFQEGYCWGLVNWIGVDVDEGQGLPWYDGVFIVGANLPGTPYPLTAAYASTYYYLALTQLQYAYMFQSYSQWTYTQFMADAGYYTGIADGLSGAQANGGSSHF